MKFCDFADINPKVKLSKEKKYSFIQMEDISPGHRYVNALKEKVFKDGGSRFEVNDILFARITPCLENRKIAQFKGNSGTIGFGSTEFFVFRAKKGISDNGYLFYLAYSDILRKPAERSMFGASGRQRVALDVVKSIIVPDISLDNQKKISAVLSAYDDLIENNTHRIQILEEMAQRIYREWFVNFRFPGHEKVKFINSEIGKIPSGWHVCNIEQLLESYSGGDWGSEIEDDNNVKQVRIIRGADIRRLLEGDDSALPTRFIPKKSFEKKNLRVGDVIVENSVNAVSRSVGTSFLITSHVLRSSGENLICASFCKNFKPKSQQLGVLIHLHLKHLINEHKMPYYQHVATNGIANFQAQRFVREEKIALPKDEALLNKMLLLLSSLQSFILPAQIMCLRKNQNILLPKLISGEISASEIDIAIREHENDS